MKKPLMATIVVIILLILTIGGFFVYRAMQLQYEKNLVDLEKFGFEISGTPLYEPTTGFLGETQLPPTFGDENLTPAERVIQGLVRDRDLLMTENQSLNQQIEALEARIARFEEARQLSDHFAPETFDEELKRVENMLNLYLQQSPDALRFTRSRLDVMAAAGRMEYGRFVRENRLMLDSAQRTQIVLEYLPAFMFCVGDGVALAANNLREEREIREYFHYPDAVRLAPPLQRDLDVVLPPCQYQLRRQLDELVPQFN